MLIVTDTLKNISLTKNKIDKLVPLPSIFFIGTNGQPIDIVTGIIASSQELHERIKNIADRAEVKLPNSNANKTEAPTAGQSTPSSSTNVNSTEEVVCENGVCRKVTKPSETTTESTATDTKALEEKVKKAKELLEKKIKDKENEEAKVLFGVGL